MQVSTTKEIKEVGMQGEKAMEVQHLCKENSLVEEILYQEMEFKLDVESWCQENYYWYYDGEAPLKLRLEEDKTSAAHEASEYHTDSDGFMGVKSKEHKSKTQVPTSQVTYSKQKDFKFKTAVSTSNIFSPLEKHQDTQVYEVPMVAVPPFGFSFIYSPKEANKFTQIAADIFFPSK